MTGARLARLGSGIGLVLGGVYALWLALEQSRPGRAGLTPGLALGLGYLAPFAVARAAGLLRDPGLRRGMWLGCGVLAVVLAMTSLAGVTLPLVVPGGLLLAGAIREQRRDRGPGPDVGTALGLVGVGVISVVVVRVWADGYGAALAVIGWAGVGAWMLARLSMDRRRHLGVRP
jgi:hypothetical protein